ncbi:Ig-like domain-containing protein [Rhizobium sp. SSA_523]|uniref:Ig-like domain-containing protein n=1 Tax=Rhizobium sp. SSA_523 TaxID=2952477 RepID=UPI002091112E|nr:Ig-like domain-containing protein [Rhizobium sp. SSA_523]MCO5731278.1 Ig-like domain-containing protein [Rhizobium sp. SSA_523]WKC22186.1 Ig-like domain-containing protein [Rhizobium sp. SSA_523]
MAIRTVDFNQVTDGAAGGADTTLSAGGLTFTIQAAGNWTANFDNGRFNFTEDASLGSSPFKITVTETDGSRFSLNDFMAYVDLTPNIANGDLPTAIQIAHVSSLSDDTFQNYPFQYSTAFPNGPQPPVATSFEIRDYGDVNPTTSLWMDNLVVDSYPNEPPAVTSIVRAAGGTGLLSKDATSASYTVKFSESVSGVDASDFVLTRTGTANGSIAQVSGSGTTYTVVVNDLTGDGTLRLDLNASGTGIVDGQNAAIQAGFTGGQTYTLDHFAPAAPSAPDLAAASDSGSSSTDDITNVTLPTFTGSAESGATVKLYDGNQALIGSGTAAQDGTWTIASTVALSEGVHTIRATATDQAGNESLSGSALAMTVDTTGPIVAVTSDRAELKIGETAKITFTFSEDPGATFSGADVTVTGGSLGSFSGSGAIRTATFTPSTNTDTSTAKITVTAGGYTDLAGNAGAAGVTPSLTVDTKAPAAPSTPDLVAASDTGPRSDDNITGDTRPTFSGVAEAGSTVTLYADGNAIGSALALDGTWSIKSDTSLAEGSYGVSATATDKAGNIGASSAALTVEVVTSAPTTSVGAILFSADSGSSSTDLITKTAAQTLSGQLSAPLAAGEHVEVSLDGGASWTTAASMSSATTWSLAATLVEGTHALQARVVNQAGNAGPELKTSYTLDTVAPGITVRTDAATLKAGQTATVTFEFTEDPGDSFTWNGNSGDVTVSGGTVSAISGSGTTRTATFTPTAGIDSGTAKISVASGSFADIAGNINQASKVHSIGYDTAAPTVTVDIVDAKLNLADDQSDVVITFSEKPSDFGLEDLVATGGKLANLQTTADPLVYTAVFKADQAYSGSGSVKIVAGSYQDAAGNPGGPASDTVLIDTGVPYTPPPTPDVPTPPIVAGTEGGILSGTAGNDSFIGSTGLDYVSYSGGISDYRVITDANGKVTAIQGPQGTDSFDGIERLVFSDGILAFDEPAKQSYRLYEAAFDRDPDLAGLSFWVGERDDGARDLLTTARDFLFSTEFVSRFGNIQQMSNSDIVQLFYQNVLDRPGEAQGVAYWQAMLDQGMAPEHALVLFSESMENRQLVDVDVLGGVRLSLDLI